jgi:hypothetical protein
MSDSYCLVRLVFIADLYDIEICYVRNTFVPYLG